MRQAFVPVQSDAAVQAQFHRIAGVILLADAVSILLLVARGPGHSA